MVSSNIFWESISLAWFVLVLTTPPTLPQCEHVTVAFLGDAGRSCLHLAAPGRTANAGTDLCASQRLQLRRCRAGAEEQRWQLRRMDDDGAQSKNGPDHKSDAKPAGVENASYQLLSKGCRLGRPKGAHPLGHKDTLLAEQVLDGGEARLQLVPGSDRFNLWTLHSKLAGNSSVSCGSHAALSCSGCPQGHGSSWCNGDCTWFPMPHLGSHIGHCVLRGTSPPTKVSCGSHEASHCSECPRGFGKGWCNGECTWKSSVESVDGLDFEFEGFHVELPGECVDKPLEDLIREQGDMCLTGGIFGEPLFQRPEWWGCAYYLTAHSPFQRWMIECSDSNATDNDDVVDVAHVNWLRREATKGNEGLERLPPWILLDVERGSSPTEVKEQFRKLSRFLHPDKQHDKENRTTAEQLFPVLQRAYEGLKDRRNAEQFKIDAEVDQLLYLRSAHVIELTPDVFETSILDAMFEDGLVWLLILYSSRDSFSRAIAPFVELAAEDLQPHGIRVGAFGCGLHGAARRNAQQSPIGYFGDPMCVKFGMQEAPSIYIVGSHLRKKLEWKMEGLPEQLVDAALEGRWLVRQRMLISNITSQLLTNDEFIHNRWIVCFTSHSKNVRLDLDEAMRMYAPKIAGRLREANVSIGFAHCGGVNRSGMVNNETVDCAAEGVIRTPHVRFYSSGRGTGQGVALLGESFSDNRDVELALEVATNILTADVNVTSLLPKEDSRDKDDQEQPPTTGTCGGFQAPSPQPLRSSIDYNEKAGSLPPPSTEGAENNDADQARQKSVESSPSVPRLTARKPKVHHGGGGDGGRSIYGGGGSLAGSGGGFIGT